MSDSEDPGWFAFFRGAFLSLLLTPLIPVVMFFIFLVGGIVIMGVVAIIAAVVGTAVPSGEGHKGHPHSETSDESPKEKPRDKAEERRSKEAPPQPKSHPRAK